MAGEKELPDSEFNEAGDFDEYNPHPYQGGYDVAARYGNPLPATPKICYPLSSAPAFTPPRVPPALPKPTSQTPFPPPQDPEPSLPPSLPPPPALPDGLASGPAAIPAAATTNYWPYAGPDGNWFVGAKCGWASAGSGNCCCGDGSRNCDGAGQWQRNAADYLFGYLPTWGPKRAETHTYANLNYAYERRRPEQALSVVVEPESRHAAEFSDSSWFLPEEETPSSGLLEWTPAYDRHSSKKPISIEVYPYNQLYTEVSFSAVYGEEEAFRKSVPYNALEWHGNNDHVDFKQDAPFLPAYQYANKSHAYDTPGLVEHTASQNNGAFLESRAYQEESHPPSLYSSALEWYNTEIKPVDSEIKLSLSSEYIHGDSYSEEYPYSDDGCHAHRTLGSERSVSVEVQPVLPQPIYQGMYQEEEKHTRSDDFYVYEGYTGKNCSSVHGDPAEDLWSRLVNGHQENVSQQHHYFPQGNSCEADYAQQVWQEPAWFWGSSIHRVYHQKDMVNRQNKTASPHHPFQMYSF